MRKISVTVLALMLAGCASIPKQVAAPKKQPAAKVATIDQTPNQAVKKRWMPKFKIKWLHQK